MTMKPTHRIKLVFFYQDTESQLDPLMKDQGLDDGEGLEGTAEESPDQSISSAMPTDSGVGEGDGAPIVQDGKLIECVYSML